jgi:SAM-dependent methyltransferase
MTAKRYDRRYFDRFYRNPRSRVLTPAERHRRVVAVLALAEHFLGRAVRSVLDVGSGPGLWARELLRARPAARYVGIDPSPAAIAAAPRGAEVLRAGFGELPGLELGGRFDLVVCADVLHYLPLREIRAGLPALVAAARGPLYIEVLTSAEGVEGDRAGIRLRRPSLYRRLFAAHGLVPCGFQLYLRAGLAERATALELLDAAPPRGARAARRARSRMPGR